MKNHNLVNDHKYSEILVEKRPLTDPKGQEVKGLFNYWILLNNPSQYNSYTTEAVKEVIMAFRQASCDRSCVSVIFRPLATKPFARVETPRSTPNTMRETLKSISSICVCLTIWFPPS